MITNLIATIIACLTTNVSEQILQPPTAQYWNTTPHLEAAGGGVVTLNGNGMVNWGYPTTPTKLVTTEVFDQRLLVLEAEGVKFTNVISSVKVFRSVDTYDQHQAPPPPPEWVKRRSELGDLTVTNSIVMGDLIVTNLFARSDATNIWLALTNPATIPQTSPSAPAP